MLEKKICKNINIPYSYSIRCIIVVGNNRTREDIQNGVEKINQMRHDCRKYKTWEMKMDMLRMPYSDQRKSEERHWEWRVWKIKGGKP